MDDMVRRENQGGAGFGNSGAGHRDEGLTTGGENGEAGECMRIGWRRRKGTGERIVGNGEREEQWRRGVDARMVEATLGSGGGGTSGIGARGGSSVSGGSDGGGGGGGGRSPSSIFCEQPLEGVQSFLSSNDG